MSPLPWSQVPDSKSRVVSLTLYTALLPFIKDISVFVSYYITALFVSFNHGHLPWASLWSVRLGMSHIERVEECFCCTFVGISLVVYALHFRIQHTRCVATAENSLAHLPLLFIKLLMQPGVPPDGPVSHIKCRAWHSPRHVSGNL